MVIKVLLKETSPTGDEIVVVFKWTTLAPIDPGTTTEEPKVTALLDKVASVLVPDLSLIKSAFISELMMPILV